MLTAYNASLVSIRAVALLLVFTTSACARVSPALPSSPSAVASTPTMDAGKPTLWIDSGVPETLRLIAESGAIPLAPEAAAATIRLQVSPAVDGNQSDWFYVLAAPFPTVLDDVTIGQVQAAWSGISGGQFDGWPLWMTETTRDAFTALWGKPGANIRLADANQLLEAAWDSLPSWAILPFESLEPRWKVLALDGQSPVRKDFQADAYGLRIRYTFTGADLPANAPELPATNRDPSRLSTVLMTGTSGLVREIAYQMEVKGLTYPGQDIRDWLREADILHISHETSFDPTCPPPNPLKSRFACGSPKYIALFDDVGLDVVEVTGNHIMDNGAASMLYTLNLYRLHGMSYFGGGADLAEARRPLLMEHNGNQIAFLGCNFAEPPQPLARPNLPGANPCDWDQLTDQVRQLREQGYVVIVTLQYKEGYSPMVMPWQSIDFRRAAEAGASIISGSQSHVPQQMEFDSGAFVHYGLGNLFFGQMANQPPGPGLPLQPAQRYEFLDRHVLYEGRYISTELLTAMLEDYARPRPMRLEERKEILRTYFAYSGWLPLVPTPAPKKTPTLYPLLDFVPLPTYTPVPKSTPTP